MSQAVGVDLSMNAGDFTQSAGLAASAANQVNASLVGLAATAAIAQRAMSNGSPRREHIAAFGGFAAAAAQSQQQLAGLNATQAVTGQRADVLARGMRQLARDLPAGNGVAQQTVQTFTQLGLSMDSQSKRALTLSKTMIQLQGANGGFAPQYAQSMSQLERTFGDQGLDPKRVAATADALTTVSKLGGAPAQSVLDFANQIGPMTQSAGIGKTATLGIATAFTRIGQDGTAAGTAVNKMLGDMSKSVRDGSPQLNTYANIVGMTADNFERLYKANPAEALTRVTEAIGKAGQQGPRMLENLGLDGVRTQRALQALTASGGLRAQINTAVGAYGSGSTQKASSAAFGGVLDNFTRAGTAAGQLGVALGTPLLRPLGWLASGLAKAGGMLAHFMDTGLGKGIAETVGLGGIAFLAARKLFGFGLTSAAIRQGATSGPVMAYAAARRMGRGDEVFRDEEGNINRVGRRGTVGRGAGAMARAYEEGRLGPVSSRTWGMGMGVNQASMERDLQRNARQQATYESLRRNLGDDHPTVAAYRERMSQTVPGEEGSQRRPGMVTRLRRGASRVAGTFMTGYSSVVRAGIDESETTDPTQRRRVGMERMSFMGGAVGQLGKDITGGEGLKNSFANFNRNLTESGRRFPGFLSGLRAVGGMGVSGIGAGARGIASGTAGLARGMWGMMGGLAGLGVMGAFAGVGYLANRNSNATAARKAEVDRQNNASPDDQINAYADSIGKATTATSNFASSVESSTKLVSTSVTTMADALKVRPEDISAAQTKTKPTMLYNQSASPAELAAQIRQMAPPGTDPSILNAIKVDLLRQFPQAKVGQTLAQVGNISTAGTPPQVGKDISTLVTEASNINIDKGGAPDSNRVGSQHYYDHMPGQGFTSKPAARSLYDTISSGITKRHDASANVMSGGYAQQERLRDINTAMMTAAKSGNEAVVNDLGDQLARQQLGIKKIPRITSDDIKRHGGYVQALAAKDKSFATQLNQMEAPTGRGGQGITLSGAGLTGGAQLSTLGRQMRDATGRGSAIAQVFDNTLTDPRITGHGYVDRGPTATARRDMVSNRDAMQQSLLQPDNLKLAATAVEGFVSSSAKGGKSLEDLATSAQKAAIANGDTTSAAYARLQEIRAEAQFQQSARAPFQTSGQNLGSQLKASAGTIAAGPGNTPETKKAYDDARGQYADAMGQMNAQIKQRLAAERNYQIQSTRANEDYTRQVANANQDFQTQQTFAAQDYFKQRKYAEQDYQHSTEIAQRDYQRQTGRAEQDYELQVSRTEQDFYTQRSREQRDFNIQMARGQDDYLTTRGRAIRDFNIQLSRQIQDQTKTLYDPYKRIQTQAVWDGHQLLANMAEQNQAIAKQSSQLSQVHKMGLSDATVQQLGLNDPANAQQLSKLVDDFMSDPKLIKQLNDSTSTRASIGKLLLTDPSNLDMQRAKADFAKQLSDMSVDYSKQVTRARQDMTKQLADQEIDFSRGLSRMSHDYETGLARNQQDFNTSMVDAAYAFDVSMARQDDAYQTSVQRSLVLFQTQMNRMRIEYDTSMKRMREDTTESEKELTLSLSQMWDAANNLMHGKSVNTNKLMKDGLADTLNYIKSGKTQKDLTTAYKNVFPYDLSHVFGGGTGGPNPGVAAPHGGPYAPYANAGAQQGMFNRVGGMGGMINPAAGANVSQGFGENLGGAPNTGGGWPVANPFISQRFGNGGPPGHPGIDLAVGRGTPIHAPLPGIVVYAGWNDGYGNCVIMDNGGGRSTLYGHQQAISAKVGDKLKAGDLIGWVDSTGNSTGDHLHFETRQNGMVQDPAVDLPIWQATAGLGSFDPGRTAAGYGVTMALDPETAVKDELKKQKNKRYGPFGSYIQLQEALKAAAKTESAALSDQSHSMITGAQTGPLQDYAKALLKKYGWSDQWNDFDYVEMREAGWNIHATNSSSGAYGLAQALPASKYASAGPDWRESGYTQLNWMMDYIFGRYGSPRAAAAHERAMNWYGDGYITTGPTVRGGKGQGERGQELLLPLNNAGVSVLARAFGMAVSADQLRTMATAGSGDRVTYVSSLTHEDHSVNLDVEKLEVTSGDPNDMARKLAAKSRSDRLTKRGGK